MTCGVALGTLALLVVALFGGAGGTGEHADPERDAAERLGPMTAVQPELRRALLTDQDLRAGAGGATPATRTGAPAASGEPVPAPQPVPVPPGAGAPGLDPPPDSEECRTLLEDPAELPRLWSAGGHRETTSQQTNRRGGSVLHQVLSVFEEDSAAAAYGRLREAAAGCHEFTAVMDGEPVRVLLRELAPGDRRESARRDGPGRRGGSSGREESGREESSEEPSEESGWEESGWEESAAAVDEERHAWSLTVLAERRTFTGWLALDRVGPVVSVLRQLGPDGAPVDDHEETRRTALGKLRPVLDLLDRLPPG